MVDVVKLKRTVTWPFLILYGLGTMVGGGFYALLGKVAGEAGIFAPVALALTGVLAILVSFAFAELSSRYPVSAGESRYVMEGFNSRMLGVVTGGMVIVTGIVSAAALVVATIGFLQEIVTVPGPLGIIILVIMLAGVAAWGIGQSVLVVAIITLIEVGALVYATSIADSSLAEVVDNWRVFVPPLDAGVWAGMFSGAFLAFYAFIGFEDMVNIAEEVKDVRRVLPMAIVVSVLITVILYMTVAAVAVMSIPPAELATAGTPVAAMVGKQGWYSTTGLVIVSMLTGLNGALVQVIMASRVAYGLAVRGDAPIWLGAVHNHTQTPVRATALVASLVLALALFFPLKTLVEITTTIILTLFAMINIALWRIKLRDPDLDGEGPRYPIWIPVLGASACISVLVFRLWLVFAD